jgi:UPF0716 protein FxsA
VPVIELAVIIQVGQVIGAWPTIALLVVESALGAWIVRRQGTSAWRAVNDALAQGRPPGRELADGALILVGGTLLLTPGFVTDVLGFFLVLPPTRALARRLLARYARRRLVVVTPGTGAPRRGDTVTGEVVDVEVVEVRVRDVAGDVGGDVAGDKDGQPDDRHG